jgi:hypothetical protein
VTTRGRVHVVFLTGRRGIAPGAPSAWVARRARRRGPAVSAVRLRPSESEFALSLDDFIADVEGKR